MDMVHRDVDVLLGHLTNDGVDQELKSELMYMRTIFKFQHLVFSGYLGFLGDSINTSKFAEHLFHSPSCGTSKECMVKYVDSLVSFIIQSTVGLDSFWTSFQPHTSTCGASEFLETLLKNLRSIKKANRRSLPTSTLDPINVLEEKLSVLKDSLHFEASSARLSTRIQVLADSAADLCFTFWVKTSDHFLDTDEISHLLYLRNICQDRVPLLEINKASEIDLLDLQILDVCKRLELVKGLLMNLPKVCIKQEKFKDLLGPIAALTSKTRFCILKEDMTGGVNDELPILLQKSREICLDIRMSLHSHFPLTDGWGFIDSLVMSLNERLDFNADLVNLVKHACSLVEDMARGVNDELPILFQKSKGTCLDVRKWLHSRFPLPDCWGFIYSSLPMSLNERLNFKADLVNLVKHKVKMVKTAIEQGKKCDSLDNLRLCIFQTAYEADYVIDTMNLNNDPPPYLQSYLYDIIKESNIIHKEISDIGFQDVVKSGKDVNSSNPLSSQVSDPPSDHKVLLVKKVMSEEQHLKELDIIPFVSMAGLGKTTLSSLMNTPSDDNVLGFKKEEEAIKEQLLTGSRELDVISIVGTSGLGKTTLANKIYNDQIVINYFHVCAWCCVSQEYNKTKLLLEIYSQVTEDELTDKMHQILIKGSSCTKVTEIDLAEKFSKCLMGKKTQSKVTETDVAEKLHNFLMGKRYLIVLDDIWETSAYYEIISCFPTEENGSRIMLTIQFDEVAHKIKLHSNPHYLPFFTKEESWELLWWKALQKERCPPELLEIAEQISESCRGLPLSIVLVAGLLTRIENKQHLWLEVAKTLNSVTFEHEKQMHVLELVYKHLPDHLKSCFLYFAAFPKDQEIVVSKLVQLWIAEGLVEKIEGKSLEDVAEDHLSTLLSSGLITVSKRRYDGSIISCLVHNTIRKFCLKRASEENFFLVISHTNNKIPMWDLACHRVCFNHQDIDCHHPLSWMQWNPGVRTILCPSNGRDSHFSKAIDFSQISRRLRLIRVLDLESITVGNTFFLVIECLPHLRFIAVHTGYVNFVLPSSLGNLHNLETLKIKLENRCMVLPKTFWNLAKLRQLDIADSFQFDFDEDDSCLKNIQALSTVVLSNKQSIGVMNRFPLLRRLKCIYIGSNESSPECNEFLELENLYQLESLHVSYDGPLKSRDLIMFKFPWSLKELSLNGFSLPACEISKFAMIPTLVALKLQNVHFTGHQWDVGEYDFRQLNYLKLHNCSIVYWSASMNSFPCLKRLILRQCMILKEVPSCFGNIATLEALEVDRCNSCLADSVLKIQREANNRSSGLMIRILKSDFNLKIPYSLDAKKGSTAVSHLDEEVVDQTKFLKDERAAREVIDKVLAATTKGRTRWTRMILTNRLKLKFMKKHKKRRRVVAATMAAATATAVKGSSRFPKKPRLSVLKRKKNNSLDIWRKAPILSRLIPGCRRQSLPMIQEEANDYIAALEMQVRALRALADLLPDASSSSSAPPT